MDHTLVGTIQEIRKNTRNMAKTKKKPMKVVYISNPVKFKTSASQFRALVQELTGQDSELPHHTTRFQDTDFLVGEDLTVLNHSSKTTLDDDNEDVEVLPSTDLTGTQQQQQSEKSEDLDDIFTPQMFENLSELMPSSLFYESTYVDV